MKRGRRDEEVRNDKRGVGKRGQGKRREKDK